MAGADAKARFPLWVSNLLVFGFLFVVVVGYFFWQARVTRQSFISSIRPATGLVAGVIRLNARGALLSQEVSEEILNTFLGNTARFIDYLDNIEPFTTEELTGFARETRLVGIYISRDRDGYVEGPRAWSQNLPRLFDKKTRLEYHASSHLYLYYFPRQDRPGWVMVGVEAAKIESLQKQLGIPGVVAAISSLPGVKYVKTAVAGAGVPMTSVAIADSGGSPVAEAKVVIDKTELAVGLDAAHLAIAISRLWRDFFIFSTALAALGVLLSYLLYRQQSRHVEQIRTYERKISAEQQDAALGRAAAAFAHEIRNPLNALSMGLQRLHIEGKELREENQQLIEVMGDAVRRTNGIVTGLLHYAAPYNVPRQPVRLDLLVENMAQLYVPRCADQQISISQTIDLKQPVSGDADLLGQAVENLLKNAVEAQPRGGFITIELIRKGTEAALAMTNGGFALPPEQAQQMTEPYFTTKAGGTGLGLAITRRILLAHGGRISVTPRQNQVIEIAVFLPLAAHAVS